MKNTLLLFTFCLLTSAQGQNFNWAAPAGTHQSYLWPWDITVDPAGNALSCGVFGGNPDFDPGPDSMIINAGQSMRGYVQKLDPARNLIWVKDFSAPPWQNSCLGVVTDELGSVYVAGTFQGTTDLDPGAGTFTAASGDESYADIYIVKLSVQGDFLWARHFTAEAQSHDGVNTLDIDVNGQYIYLGGVTQGTIDADPTSGTYVLDCDSTHGFICKLDTSGQFVWGKTIGGLSGCFINAISTDAQGNVYSSGMLLGPYNDFDPGPAVYQLNYGWSADLFVSKLNASGNFVWAKSVSGYDNQWANDMIIDGGKLYMTGMYADSTDFDPGPGTYTLTSPSNQGYGCNAFLLSLDTTGAFQWVRGFGGYGDERGEALIKTKSGDLYCAGNYSGFPTTDFDPGPGTFTLGWDYGNSVHYDMFISHFDGSGNFISAGRIGSNYSDEAYGLATDNYNSVFLTGRYQLTVDVDPGAGTYTVPGSYGNYQSIVIKFSDTCSVPAAPGLLSAQNVTLCSPGIANFTASPGSYVVWYDAASGGNAVNSGSVLSMGQLPAGTYTWYASAYTCKPGTVRTPVRVDVFAYPSLTLTSTSTLICEGETATITVTGANSFLWDDNSTQASHVVSPLSDTNYSVTGANAGTCFTSANFLLEVDPCLGIRDNDQTKISLHPNPSSGIFYLDSVHPGSTVEVFDMTGRKVDAGYDADNRRVDLQKAKSGLYNLRITWESVHVCIKVVVE